ncbi:MAG TPA: SRPBCC domain-containing protein [Gemmatimonadales bacterium]|nr:SRPBCC domain-containing protein [Gemmatimonadales bacterium]
MALDASAPAATDREIVVTRIIEGPRRIVFDAFTDPERLGRWWGPTGAAITTRSFDFRPGGVWDATIKGPQGEFPNYVVWKEITPPERIVWMYYGMGKDDPNPVETTLTLAARGDVTEATLRLMFGSKEARETALKYHALAGAKLTLERLAAVVAQGKGQ